jgi:hypothetical protein
MSYKTRINSLAAVQLVKCVVGAVFGWSALDCMYVSGPFWKVCCVGTCKKPSEEVKQSGGGAGHGSKWMLSPEVMLEASFVLLNARSAMEGRRKVDKFGTSKNLKNV